MYMLLLVVIDNGNIRNQNYFDVLVYYFNQPISVT